MAEGRKLHIAVFPWLAFGHMIPYLELSKLIAQKGHKISFISTPRNIDRLSRKIPESLSSIIDLVKLPLPEVPGLPPAAEATYDIPTQQVPLLKKAYDGLQDGVASFLRSAAPDWVVYDFSPHWLPPIAADLGISRAFFCIFSAVGCSNILPPTADVIASGGVDPRKSPEEFTVPPKWVDFPTKITFQLFEGRLFCSFMKDHRSSDISDIYRAGLAVSGCDVVAVRTSDVIEAPWVDLMSRIHERRVIPVGLLPPEIPAPGKVEEEGNDYEEMGKWEQIREWLGKQRKGSVLYVAFGSEPVIGEEQLREVAVGLENSGVHFLWVLREKKALTAKLPEKFEERAAGRGVVWTSWAPQLQILAHESIGAFLTHCGYSSIIEGLSFGLPLLMLPLVIDLAYKHYHEKQVAVVIPRNEEDGSFTSDDVARSISLVMADDATNVYKLKAKEMKKIVSDPIMQDQYILNFLNYLESHKLSSID